MLKYTASTWPVAYFTWTSAGRDILVYDLMECARGSVDGLVLDLLSETPLHAGDFVQTTDRRCRLHPQLVRVVAGRCRVSLDQLNEHAKWLAAQTID